MLKKIKNSKGFVMAWTVIFLGTCLGCAALAIDLSYAYVISNELKSVADAAALTAASSYLVEYRKAVGQGKPMDGGALGQINAAVRNSVNAIRQRNKVLNLSVSGAIDLEIQYGKYTSNNQPYDGTQFTSLGLNAQPDQINAFRVYARRGNTGANKINSFFAKSLGVQNFSIERDTVARLTPRNFELIIDTSSSMDDITYIPLPIPRFTEVSLPLNAFVIYTDERHLPSPRFTPFAPGPSDRYPGFETTIYPQPLQVVLDSSLQFIQSLYTRTNLGDQAGVVYFSDSFSQKLSLTSVDANTTSANGVFANLFSNQDLYKNLIKGPTTPLIFGLPFPPNYVLNASAPTFDFTKSQFDGNIAIPYGDTNIGDAITAAAGDIKNSSTSVESISVIVLFTDGEPTCAPGAPGGPCFGANATGAQLRLAREYTYQKATAAMKAGILIYPIIFGRGTSDSNLLMDEIARLSGLTGRFSVPNTYDVKSIQSALNKVFDQISLLIPFVLVN